MVDFSPTEEEQAIIDQVRKFAQTELRQKLRDYEKNGSVAENTLRKYHEMGLSTIDIPQEYGGMGLGMRTAALVQEELSFGDVGAAMALSGPGFAGYAILALGSENQKKRFLEPFSQPGAYAKFGSLCIYEEKMDSDMSAMETTAKKENNYYILNGKKFMIHYGGTADIHVVFAVIDRSKGMDGIGAFVIEKGVPGIKITRKLELLGLNTCSITEIALENVKVPSENLLNGTPLKKGMQGMYERIRVIHAARAVGLGKAALDYAVEYSKVREAFGKPIGQHQGLSFMLADMATEVDAARWLVWKAAWHLDQGEPASLAVSMSFVQANEMAMTVANNAVQILGGHGYIQDHPVEKWMRDAKTMGLVIGTTQGQNQRIFNDIAGIYTDVS